MCQAAVLLQIVKVLQRLVLFSNIFTRASRATPVSVHEPLTLEGTTCLDHPCRIVSAGFGTADARRTDALGQSQVVQGRGSEPPKDSCPNNAT